MPQPAHPLFCPLSEVGEFIGVRFFEPLKLVIPTLHLEAQALDGFGWLRHPGPTAQDDGVQRQSDERANREDGQGAQEGDDGPVGRFLRTAGCRGRCHRRCGRRNRSRLGTRGGGRRRDCSATDLLDGNDQCAGLGRFFGDPVAPDQDLAVFGREPSELSGLGESVLVTHPGEIGLDGRHLGLVPILGLDARELRKRGVCPHAAHAREVALATVPGDPVLEPPHLYRILSAQGLIPWSGLDGRLGWLRGFLRGSQLQHQSDDDRRKLHGFLLNWCVFDRIFNDRSVSLALHSAR